MRDVLLSELKPGDRFIRADYGVSLYLVLGNRHSTGLFSDENPQLFLIGQMDKLLRQAAEEGFVLCSYIENGTIEVIDNNILVRRIV